MQIKKRYDLEPGKKKTTTKNGNCFGRSPVIVLIGL